MFFTRFVGLVVSPGATGNLGVAKGGLVRFCPRHATRRIGQPSLACVHERGGGCARGCNNFVYNIRRQVLSLVSGTLLFPSSRGTGVVKYVRRGPPFGRWSKECFHFILFVFRSFPFPILLSHPFICHLAEKLVVCLWTALLVDETHRIPQRGDSSQTQRGLGVVCSCCMHS